MAARTAADGKWVRSIARTAADSMGAREWLEMVGERDERAWLRGWLPTANGWGSIARTAADGVGAREWLELVVEKKPLVMSELAGTGWGEEGAGD